MGSMVIMVMKKDRITGFFEKEIGSYTIENNGELIEGVYLYSEDDKDIINLRLTVERDVEDWEFSAIFEEYDMTDLEQYINTFSELDEFYNPVWEVTFDFVDNQNAMERILDTIIAKHKQELDRVYGEIEGKKSDYD